MLRKVFLFVVSLCLMQNVSIANSDYEFEFYHILNGEVIAENRDNVIISFDMVNDTSNYYSKLFYVPMLEVRGTDTANITYLPYQVYEPKEFSLKPYETKTLVYECKLPKTLPNKKLMITANLYSEFYSEPFGKVAFNLKTVGDDFEGFLESDGISYFKPDKGEIIKADKEFTLDKTNLPKMYIKLKSSFEIEKIVYPYYALYERNNAVNKPFYTDYGEKIVFKSGETKEVELDLPSILGSEKYLMTLSFVDGSGNKVSNLYEYKYVISGENAKITEIVFDSEESKVKAYLYGTDELKDTEVEIKVYDKNKNLLFNKKAIIDLKTEDMYVDTILENISNDKVDVTVGITYKGKELVTKTEEVKLNIEAGVDKFLDIKGKECERAVKILNSLEIINGYPNNTYNQKI